MRWWWIGTLGWQGTDEARRCVLCFRSLFTYAQRPNIYSSQILRLLKGSKHPLSGTQNQRSKLQCIHHYTTHFTLVIRVNAPSRQLYLQNPPTTPCIIFVPQSIILRILNGNIAWKVLRCGLSKLQDISTELEDELTTSPHSNKFLKV